MVGNNMHITYFLLHPVVTTFITTLFLITILRPCSTKLSLIDSPQGRKRHQGDIPLIGGIAIFGACLLPNLHNFQFDHMALVIFVFGLCILGIGIADDVLDLKPNIKLLLSTLVITQVPILTEVKLTNFENLFGFGLSVELGVFSIPLTIISILGLMNAFNMVDGCDGLAGGLATLAVATIGFLGWSSLSPQLHPILISLVVSLVLFLYFNMTQKVKAKIFLGDAGSMFLGFVISVLLIYSAEEIEGFRPTIALWVVAVPLYDFFGVIARRWYLKRNLFSADRSHIHHFLLHRGLSHQKTTAIVVIVAITLLCVGLFVEKIAPELSFYTFLTLFFIYLWARIKYAKSS